MKEKFVKRTFQIVNTAKVIKSSWRNANMHITVQENLITYPNIKPAKKANAKKNNVHTATRLNQALNPKIRLACIETQTNKLNKQQHAKARN